MDKIDNEKAFVRLVAKGGRIIISVKKLEDMCEILQMEKKAGKLKDMFIMPFDTIEVDRLMS